MLELVGFWEELCVSLKTKIVECIKPLINRQFPRMIGTKVLKVYFESGDFILKSHKLE